MRCSVQLDGEAGASLTTDLRSGFPSHIFWKSSAVLVLRTARFNQAKAREAFRAVLLFLIDGGCTMLAKADNAGSHKVLSAYIGSDERQGSNARTGNTCLPGSIIPSKPADDNSLSSASQLLSTNES